MILAFYNIAIFDKYFGVFGSDLRASRPRMFDYKMLPPELYENKVHDFLQPYLCT